MKNNIPLSEVQYSQLSLVDDVGKVFFWKDRIFRAITDENVKRVEDIFSCGMIKELVDNNLCPESWITDYKFDCYNLVIEHKKIHPVIYPYEWTFSMLKNAAITTLKVNLIARKYGYQTKDAHGYNILFDGAHPKFVDLGSFMKVENKSKGWIAFEEFIRFYLNPLHIWSTGNDFIARRLLLSSEIMPCYSYLLYKYPLLRLMDLGFLKKITLLYYGYRNVSLLSKEIIKDRLSGNFGDLIIFLKNKRLLPLQSINFTSLIKRIEKISRKKQTTIWHKYHDKFYDKKGTLISSPRFDRVISVIKSYKIKSIVELGGNQGVFSRLLLERTNIENIICTDYDECAMDICYLNSKKYDKMTTAILDIISPLVSCRNEVPAVRFRSDAVVALAVTHHLILAQSIPIETILNTISLYSRRYVFIEFMPIGLWDGINAPPTPSWYTLDWFRSSFESFFNIMLEEQTEENRILFVGETKGKFSNDDNE